MIPIVCNNTSKQVITPVIISDGGGSTPVAETDPIWTADKANYLALANLTAGTNVTIDKVGSVATINAVVPPETDPVWLADKPLYQKISDIKAGSNITVSSVAGVTTISTNPLFKGGFSAASGTIEDSFSGLPTPAAANKGWTYLITTPGLYGTTSYMIGDHIKSNGTAWVRVIGSEYRGSFSAKTGSDENNSQVPAASAANLRHTYLVTTAGNYFGLDLSVGDQIRSDGTNWIKIPTMSVSAAIGNAIEVKTDGLFVSPAKITPFTDDAAYLSYVCSANETKVLY